jgi:hypothetical protein
MPNPPRVIDRNKAVDHEYLKKDLLNLWIKVQD